MAKAVSEPAGPADCWVRAELVGSKHRGRWETGRGLTLACASTPLTQWVGVGVGERQERQFERDKSQSVGRKQLNCHSQGYRAEGSSIQLWRRQVQGLYPQRMFSSPLALSPWPLTAPQFLSPAPPSLVPRTRTDLLTQQLPAWRQDARCPGSEHPGRRLSPLSHLAGRPRPPKRHNFGSSPLLGIQQIWNKGFASPPAVAFAA